MMSSIYTEIGGVIVLILGILWGAVVFFHTINIPLSEEQMRRIVKEEVKKIMADDKKR